MRIRGLGGGSAKGEAIRKQRPITAEAKPIHIEAERGHATLAAGLSHQRSGTSGFIDRKKRVALASIAPSGVHDPGAGAISRLVPSARLTVLQEEAASEARVRDAASGRAVLHFATHAIVRDDDPFGSFLALGRSASGASADGLLTAQEVYGLDLSADLVVLSACRSGGGRVTGDGIATFARAFLYAGTPSLVASLWDVADEPVNRLLPDFYRAWLGGESKGAALRTAQLRLLRDLRAGRIRLSTRAGPISLPEHPVFWAGFALFGEPN